MTSIPQFAATRARSRQLILFSLDVWIVSKHTMQEELLKLENAALKAGSIPVARSP